MHRSYRQLLADRDRRVVYGWENVKSGKKDDHQTDTEYDTECENGVGLLVNDADDRAHRLVSHENRWREIVGETDRKSEISSFGFLLS